MTVVFESGQDNKIINLRIFLNGIYTSIKNIVPKISQLERPRLLGESLTVKNGVSIGTFGDLNGSLIITGVPEVFCRIAEMMYGMKLEGEMLSSFKGELTNMIAGSLSTIVELDGMSIDISVPSFMNDEFLSGYHKAIQVKCEIVNGDHFDILFLLEKPNLWLGDFYD